MTAEDVAAERENRRQIVAESPLNPLSLCGSWALYRSSDGVEQALVVAEPQPGVYLLELYDVVTDEPQRQRLVKLDTLCAIDDEGGTWTFYDDRAAVRAEFRAMLA